MPKIKCLLVDDHTLFRQGVRRLLESESDFEVVGEAADGGEAVEKARELRPDIVLMDIGMPGLSSFESARQIKKNRMETKILFLTMYEDEDYLVQCLEVGASGYVLKDTPAPQLLTAVKDVYKGGKYLSSQVLGKLVEDFRSRVRDTRMRPRISTLTPREREILKLLAEGNSVKEIAVILGLSVKTVEAHKFNLMRKLDIHNKAQLVTYAIQKKIIKIPVNQYVVVPSPQRRRRSQERRFHICNPQFSTRAHGAAVLLQSHSFRITWTEEIPSRSNSFRIVW